LSRRFDRRLLGKNNRPKPIVALVVIDPKKIERLRQKWPKKPVIHTRFDQPILKFSSKDFNILKRIKGDKREYSNRLFPENKKKPTIIRQYD
jgi:hypothetical protein